MENPFEIIFEKLERIEHILSQMSNKQKETELKSGETQINLMTVDQVASYLSVAKPTIYGYTMNRILPHSKRGKRLYFIKSEIDEWITKHRVKTIEKLEEEAIELLTKRSYRRR